MVYRRPKNEEERRKTNAYMSQRRRDMKAKAVALRGGECEKKCGYSGPALSWHHRDPSKKKGSFTASIKTWDKFWAETQECDLICANCHIEEHAKDWQSGNWTGRPRKDQGSQV